MRKLFGKHGSATELGDGIEFFIKLSGFALVLVYTRYLSPLEFGVLALLYVIVRVVDTVVVQGMTSAVSRASMQHFERGEHEQRMSSSTAFWYAFACAGLVFGAFALVAGSMSELLFEEATWTNVVRWFAVAGILRATQNVPRQIFRLQRATVRIHLLALADFVVAAGLNIYFVVVAKQGLLGIAHAEVIRESIFLVVMLGCVREHLRFSFSRAALRELLGNGLPKVPRGISYLAGSVSDRFFLAVYATTAHLGLYAFAYRFAELLELGARPLARGLPELHRLGRAQPDHGRALVGRYMTYFVTLIGLLGLTIVVFTKPVMEIVTPIEYFPVVEVVPLLVLGLCLASIQRVLLLGVHIQQGAKVMPRIISIAALVNLACNFWWISRHGMWGAATATTVTHAVLCGVVFVVDRRHFATRFEFGRLARVAATVTITYGISVWATPENLVGQIAAGMAVVLLYPALLGVFGFYTDDELERLRELVNHRVSLRPNLETTAEMTTAQAPATDPTKPQEPETSPPARETPPPRPLQPR